MSRWKSEITVQGLAAYNPDLFSGMQLPEGVNLETMALSIVERLGNLEILYPDAELMQRLIASWSVQRVAAWGRMVAALNEEYNPLHNFDRYEEYENKGLHKVAGFNPRDLVENGASNTEHEGHVYGNVGSTKSQEMLRDEIDVRGLDIYHIITEEFKTRFCIMVY